MKTVHIDLSRMNSPLLELPEFNAQHAPMGAYMSFTCGHFGSGGGIGIELGHPARQNLYIGVKQGARRASAPLRCLPFIRRDASPTAAGNFQPEQTFADNTPAGIDTYPSDQIRRRYGWATDSWTTPDFEFRIYTPFGPIPDPKDGDVDALRAALLPAVIATLAVDNRDGTEPRTAVFAIDFVVPGARLLTLPDASPARAGFAWRREMGVAALIEGAPDESPQPMQRWSVLDGLADLNPVHGLGTLAGLSMEVPPGQSRTLVLAIGCYREGIVTSGLEARYFYTRLYNGIEDVLASALRRATELRTRSAGLDARLRRSPLSDSQQFLVAHGTRSYYGNTQLLDVGGEPLFIVNEGEYCMMNTLDLSVDQAFWELDRNPWVVRNILEHFVRRYSYCDNLVTRGGEQLPGGISFTHDMGANNQFAAPGHSSYELPNLRGCFSFMTQEQLCNWILLASCYVARTRDIAWLRTHWHVVEACAASMSARASPRTGIMAHDSARCIAGAEITTYDSLDESLGQARANSYIAVKSWAAWVGIGMLVRLKGLSADGLSQTCATMTEAIASHLCQVASAGDGTLPAVLEKDSPGHASRILPAAEGLVYPAYWVQHLNADGEAVDDVREWLDAAMQSPLVTVLRGHTLALLTDPQRRNLFTDGGIRLSSTSSNSWMSKIALFQHVARSVLKLHEDPAVSALFAAADAAHVRWQIKGGGYWACSDQFVDGKARGSRYYPRCITAALWLDAADSPPAPADADTSLAAQAE